MRQTELHLSDEDRISVDKIRAKGVHHSREVNRCHILSCLDRGMPESQIMEVLGVGRTAIWRTRAAYLQGGVDLAVFDMARSGRPARYDTDDEARITALACSAPPEGRQRWTIVALERAARQEPGLSGVSRETIRRMLKKRPETLVPADVVHRLADAGAPGSDAPLAGLACQAALQQRAVNLH